MNIREEFEARFPVPAGVKWDEAHQNYGWVKKQSFQQTITYRALWTGWKESRVALEIELPTEVDASVGKSWSSGFNSARTQSQAALEAAGVRIKS